MLRVNFFASNIVPKKRKGHSMVVYKNKMYMFGGYYGSYEGDLWMYIPDNERWKRIDIQGIMPVKRASHCACMYKSKMIVFGGDSGRNETLNDLWEIDLGVNINNFQWNRIIARNRSPRARYAHSGAVINDKLYVFGGYGGMYLDDLWEFDFKTLVWNQIQPIHKNRQPERRSYHSMVVLPQTNFLLLYGGSNGNYLNDLWLFDTITHIWYPIEVVKPIGNKLDESGFRRKKGFIDETIPAPRAKFGAVALRYDSFLIQGGMTGFFRENDMWIFRILNLHDFGKEMPNLIGEWIKLEFPINVQIPVPRDSHTLTLIGRDIWLFGGCGKGIYFNDLWRLPLEKVIANPLIKDESIRRPFNRESIELSKRESLLQKFDNTLSQPKTSRKQPIDQNLQEYDRSSNISGTYSQHDHFEYQTELLEQYKQSNGNNDSWRQEIKEKISRLEQCIFKQTEAIDALSRVVNKEIERRVAGELKSEKIFNLIKQQMDEALWAQQNNLSKYYEVIDTISTNWEKSYN